MAVTKPNAMHLALWTIAGTLLAASAFYLTFTPISHVNSSGAWFGQMQWADRIRLMIFLLPLISGLVIWYLADRKFRRGFADGIWSEVELARVQTMVKSSAWRWLFGALMVTAILAVAFSSKSHGIFIYVLTFPMNAVSSLQRLLSPPTRERDGLFDWRNSKPLQSDHWGEVRHADQLPS